jgi:hypothetical protein
MNNAMIYTLATLHAKNLVKAEIRKRGYKLHDYTAKAIMEMTMAYLDAHRSTLLEYAHGMIERSPELKKMYEKEERRRLRTV